MIIHTAVVVSLALTDLHGLCTHGRDASLLLQPRSRRRQLHVLVPPLSVRGGGRRLGENGRDAADPRQPNMSVISAWSKLASKRQSATEEDMSVSTADDDNKMSLPSPSLLAKTLAAVWSTWNILDGILLTFAPKDDPHDVVVYLVEAIGVVRISHGLQLFLSTVVGVPSKTSMGVAILSRLIFLMTCTAMKTCEQLGVLQSTASQLVLVSAGGMFLTALALLSDRGRPYLMANLFSAMAFVKGCYMRFCPNQTSTKLFRCDAATNFDRVPAKVRILGFHLIISSVFMNALANGTIPIKAAGYSAVAWSVLLVDLIFGAGVYRGWKAVTGTYLFFLASALSCSFVFLLDNKWETFGETFANLKRKRLRHIKGKLPKPIPAKEKMDKLKLRINTIASSVGASTLATIGAKVGSILDEKLVSEASGPLMAKIDPKFSRIIPTCSTVGTAMGASLGAMVGIKVANFIFARLEEVQRKVRPETIATKTSAGSSS